MAVSLLPTLQTPDDDTLAKLLATYQAPTVVSGGGPLGTTMQAKLGSSTAQPTLLPSLGTVQTQDTVPMPTQDLSLLPTVSAPSRASLGSTDADNALVAAQAKEKADTPQKYDWSQHSLLGKIGHVAAGIGNAVGDAYSPELMTLINGTTLNKEARLAQDKKDVQLKTENAANAGKELDAVNNEEANREAEAPLRAAQTSAANANTTKATQETADLVSQNKPTDQAGADKLNKMWGTDVFAPGMTPQEVSRAAEAIKTTQEMKDRKDEFTARLNETAQAHRDSEADRAEARAERIQFHQDSENDKQTAAQAKTNKPFQDVVNDVDEAKEFAGQKTGYGDYGLVMKFVDATKPSSGFRFNQTEAGQIYGARSIADKFRVAYESGKTGILLSDTQRDQILKALEVPYNAAQKHLQGGGSSNSQVPGSKPSGSSTTTLKFDAQGNPIK